MSGQDSPALPESSRSEASTSAQEQIELHPENIDPKFKLLECKAALRALRGEVENMERFLQLKSCNKGRAQEIMVEIRELCDHKFIDRLQLIEELSRQFPFRSGEVSATAKRNPTKFLLTDAQRMKINKEKYDTRKRVLTECKFYVKHMTEIKRMVSHFCKNFDNIISMYPREQKQERVAEGLNEIYTALSIYYP